LQDLLVEFACGAGQQVEHSLALRMNFERLGRRAAKNLAAGVAGPRGMSAWRLNDEFFRGTFDRGQPALAISQDKIEPAGVPGPPGFLNRAFQAVLVKHLSDEYVAGDADAWTLDPDAVAPGPAQTHTCGV